MPETEILGQEKQQDNIVKIDGTCTVILQDAEGNVVHEETYNNIITSAGKGAIAGLVGNTGSVTAFTYLAVGTSATTPVVGDTALGGEISTNSLARAGGTVSRTTTTYTNDTLKIAYTWTASGASTVQEAGIFNASSAGTMLSHLLIGPVTTSNGFQLTLNYTVQFS
ncbi:hypothetical protein CV133_gene39 [Chlorobiaceae phage CV-1-33]|nr:hypothetical protein [Chlorobiaceae bacterium]QOE32046.1 hypothetical protein CV133_gene39 [Chlorobiaceae phage CV-1-33]